MSEHKLKKQVEIHLVRSRYTKRYHLRLVGGNNKIRLTSQTYFSHFNAKRAGEDLSTDTGFPFVEKI